MPYRKELFPVRRIAILFSIILLSLMAGTWHSRAAEPGKQWLQQAQSWMLRPVQSRLQSLTGALPVRSTAADCPLPLFEKISQTTTTDFPQIVTGDFNGDGKTDVAFTESKTKNITVYSGAGTGEFTLAGTYETRTVGLSAPFLIAGDFNGDTKTDLLTVSLNSSGASKVWISDGKGGFSPGAEFRLSSLFPYLVSDFNRDGKADLAVSNFVNETFSIYLADGAGNFTQLPAKHSLPGSYRLVAADFNNDGEADIVGSTSDNDRVRIFYGNGKGEFSAGTSVNENLTSLLPDYSLPVQAVDVNRDGRMDLLAGTTELVVLLNEGAGKFRAGMIPQFSTLLGTGDVNGDGYADALGNEHIAFNDGKGSFCLSPLQEGLSRTVVAAADFNQDNKTDLLTQGASPGFSAFLSRTGTAPVNSPPNITGAAAEIRQLQFPGQELVLATVSDAETAAGLLIVTLPAADNLGNGISGINDLKNNDGKITARINTSCTDPAGKIQKLKLRVTDGGGLSAETEATIRVLPNAPPVIMAPETLTIPAGKEATFEVELSDDIGLSSNGSLQVDSPGFAGRITPLLSSMPGIFRFSITNASPVGTHLITLSARDACQISATRQLRLVVTGEVTKNPPQITTAGMISLKEGSTLSNVSIATVSDAETLAENLKIEIVRSESYGVNLFNIRNDNGQITASISARCEEVLTQNVFQLRVTDADGNFAVGELRVMVTPPPRVVTATYPREVIFTGEPLTINPLTPGRDFSSVRAFIEPLSTGKIAIENDGAVMIEGPIRPGRYTVTAVFASACMSNQASFLLTVPDPSPAGCDTITFAAQQQYESGNTPSSVVSEDFNRDGLMDIASVSQSASSVNVLLAKTENGARAFIRAGRFTTDAEPRFISSGDFNRDGKPDLVTANYAGNSLSVLDGNGDGTFTEARRFPVIGNPFSVNVADFNRDGNPDLLVVTDIGAKVALLLGNGKGSFDPPTYFNAGDLPQPPEISDFDDDGNMDLLVPDYLGKRIALLRNDGKGSFSAPLFIDAGRIIGVVATADFDGDGIREIAALDSDNNSIVLLRKNESGNFTVSDPLAVGFYPASMVIHDFNGDGKPDLAAGNYSENTITILLNDGTGNFDPSQARVIEVGWNPLSLIAQDFNGDKRPDLAIANSGAGTISVIFGECGNTPSAASSPEIAVTSAASYFSQRLAKETIAVVFGSEFTGETRSAGLPLPNTLGGVSVTITDSKNISRNASLFFVSPAQVNYQIPADVASGPATVSVRCASGKIMQRRIIVTPYAPGLFTADASGRGLPAAILVRVKSDSRQFLEPIIRFDPAGNAVVAAPIEFGAESDELYLTLFGTGIRHRRSLEKVSAKIGGISVPVTYAGAQNDFTGLDQINLKLPRLAALHGEKEIEISVEGFAANKVRVTFR